jgi:hypothetical protein
MPKICPLCLKETKRIPVMCKPSSSEDYCEGCHKSYPLSKEEIDQISVFARTMETENRRKK